MSRIRLFIIVTILAIVVGFVGYAAVQLNTVWNGYPDNQPTQYLFDIQSGDSVTVVAALLEADNVIISQDAFILQERLSPISPLQVGAYSLTLPANNQEILMQIDEQTDEYAAIIRAAGNRKSATVTFQEGMNIDEMALLLEEAGVITAAEFTAFAQDPANFDRQAYPFLPEPLGCTYGNIQQCAKYYPEGYLYPDTYSLFVGSTAQEVYDRLLSNFSKRVWTQLPNPPSAADLYDVMVRASVIEKETGRPAAGVSAQNRDEVNNERQLMSQVFLNRSVVGQRWQSDVTAEYGHGRKLCQQTFSVPNCIALDDPVAVNAYNTYIIQEAPIGPVTNPQYDVIFSTLNPIDNNYFFFLSDVTGKKYFYENAAAFNAGISEITRINQSLGVQ